MCEMPQIIKLHSTGRHGHWSVPRRPNTLASPCPGPHPVVNGWCQYQYLILSCSRLHTCGTQICLLVLCSRLFCGVIAEVVRSGTLHRISLRCCREARGKQRPHPALCADSLVVLA